MKRLKSVKKYFCNFFYGKVDRNDPLMNQKQEPSLDEWLSQFYTDTKHNFRIPKAMTIDM